MNKREWVQFSNPRVSCLITESLGPCPGGLREKKRRKVLEKKRIFRYYIRSPPSIAKKKKDQLSKEGGGPGEIWQRVRGGIISLQLFSGKMGILNYLYSLKGEGIRLKEGKEGGKKSGEWKIRGSEERKKHFSV